MFTYWPEPFRRLTHRILPASLLALALSACGKDGEPWTLYDVQGHLPDLQFSLAASGGRTVTQADLAGQTVLLFFGYANCPDICPTTMAQLSEVLRRLSPEHARAVRIVFVSVDPHRDTPERLQAYVNAFNDQAIGLTGSEPQIAALARRYRVAYQIEKPAPGDDDKAYDVTHARAVYIFDAKGRARLMAADSDSVEAIVTDLARLLASAE